MDELTRRAYLDVLGIDSYVSRAQLPGAAPTRRLALVPRTVAPVTVVPSAPLETNLPPAQTGQVTPVPRLPSLNAGSGRVEPKLEVAEAPSAPTSSVPAPAFSIAAIVAGGWLWLEELAPPPLAQEQVRLVQAMVHALGWRGESIDVSQFDWPIHTNAQLDLGENAARAGLGGFVGRKLERDQSKGIVILGDGCKRWLSPEQFGALPCVVTVATADMLRDGQVKRQAWRDLAPHARRE